MPRSLSVCLFVCQTVTFWLLSTHFFLFPILSLAHLDYLFAHLSSTSSKKKFPPLPPSGGLQVASSHALQSVRDDESLFGYRYLDPGLLPGRVSALRALVQAIGSGWDGLGEGPHSPRQRHFYRHSRSFTGCRIQVLHSCQDQARSPVLWNVFRSLQVTELRRGPKNQWKLSRC